MKEDGSISTFMYNDQGQLINETQYNPSKQKTKELYWVWVESMPLAQVEIPFTNNVAGTHTINYLHTDHLNTPRWATNQSKQKVWSWQSDAYGNTLANEDPLNTGYKTTIPLRFPGQYYDQETRLHYNYFRTYDPDLGRYTQPDPIGLDGGWNMFTYVDGNPLRYSDPKGLALPFVIPAICAAGACETIAYVVMGGVGFFLLWNSNIPIPNSPSNALHPEEQDLIDECNPKLVSNPYWGDPFNNNRCQRLQQDINLIVGFLDSRETQMINAGGGDLGHQGRYIILLNALRIYVKAAKKQGCPYNPRADQILNKPYVK